MVVKVMGRGKKMDCQKCHKVFIQEGRFNRRCPHCKSVEYRMADKYLFMPNFVGAL